MVGSYFFPPLPKEAIQRPKPSSGIGALSSYFAALGADMFVHVDAKIDETPFREAAAAGLKKAAAR